MNDKHVSLREDFANRVDDWIQTEEDEEALVNSLVHLVVLHGLLPEVQTSCEECGYEFTYPDEGCDTCAPRKVEAEEGSGD